MANITPAQAAAILLERKKARATLAGFAEHICEVQPALHHTIICDHLERLMADEWDELIILAPPGSAKSTYTSVAFPPYVIGKSPRPIHFLSCSYSADLAEKWGRRNKNMIGTEEYQALFPGIEMSKDSSAAGKWATTRGDELYAAGVGGGILGFRADVALIDDPISGFEQAQSITQLSKIHSWYETDFVTRLKPNAKVVLICQRLARNDLAGYMIDRNAIQQTRRQHILRLPMELEEGETDVTGRKVGERLWPEWFTSEMVLDAKRDDFKWRTLYQQKPPADTGSWVSEDEIQVVDIVPAEMLYYILSDIALSVNRGDYSVHLVAGTDTDGNAYIVDAWRDRKSPEIVAEKHLDLAIVYKPQLALIDDDNAGKVYKQLLAVMAKERHVPCPYKALPIMGQDKETRAAPLRGMFKRRKMFFKRAPWNTWLFKELLEFPNALGDGVDDGVDALGLIGRHLYHLSRTVSPEQPQPELKTINQVTLNELWEHRERTQGMRARL